MAENTGNNNSTAADTVSALVKGAGASKAGKALPGKAAGPYGTLAVSAWENRKTVFAILCALLFLLMLPVLFILMLPSLIFGNGGLDDVPENVLNDNEVIMENIAEAETSIEAILREKHDAVLGRIQAEADALGSDCEYSITDEFADQIIYESALIISQFCASQEDFREVKLAALEGILRRNTDGIFSYTTEVTSREEEDEETGETHTIYHYEYTVSYAGDAYFAGNVFFLSEEQAETAAQYASNLHLFLFDTVYHVEINPDLVPGETGNAAVDLALTKLGTPYSQANRDKKGYFDCSFLTDPLYASLESYTREHQLPHFTQCVVCFSHVFDKSLSDRRVRDYDNLECKQLLDTVAGFLMTDDSGLFCDAYHTTEFGEQDCTILAVMEKSCFPGWLKEREDREKTISDF